MLLGSDSKGLDMNASAKSGYSKPSVTMVGSFEEITLGNATGSFLDAPFQAGQPISSLTFS